MSSIATPTRPRREHPRLRAKIIALGWRPALEDYGSWYGSWDGGASHPVPAAAFCFGIPAEWQFSSTAWYGKAISEKSQYTGHGGLAC